MKSMITLATHIHLTFSFQTKTNLTSHFLVFFHRVLPTINVRCFKKSPLNPLKIFANKAHIIKEEIITNFINPCRKQVTSH